MKDFSTISEDRIIFSNDYFFIIKDAYPVSPGHLLIISKHVRNDFFDLTEVEKKELISAIDIGKNLIEKEFSPNGYNIGMNCGEAAGQTIFHFHCHIIPRYKDDMANPQGGIRHCVQGKGNYEPQT
jgi:diadenosine tetraphosphate (Ap4A) HIT family hydrolase